MRAIKRYIASIGLLIVMALSLAGCVHIDRNVSLNSDGSGSYVLTIGFNDQLLSLSGDQTTTMMNGFGDQVKKDGGSYREYEEAGYTYWAYTRPFTSVTDLNNFLTQMPQSGGSPTGAVSTSGTDTISFTEQPGFVSNTFHVTGHISLNLPTGSADTGGIDISPYLKDMRDSFAVTMPGSITSHKGGAVNGDTVTYTVHYGEETDIDVVGSALNTGTLVPTGAGVAVLLLAIVGFILWRRRGATSDRLGPQAVYGGGAQYPAPSWPLTPSTPPDAPSMVPTPTYEPPSPLSPSYSGPSASTPPPYGPPSSTTPQSPGPGAPNQ